jgi:radical SAM superfamily enzyme YgiQ (UPF0313 family)
LTATKCFLNRSWRSREVIGCGRSALCRAPPKICDALESSLRFHAIDSRPLAELNQLHAAGWREAVFTVDDNFIGNTARAKELCVALTEWLSRHRTRFNFTPEASLNLVDDPELMQLMKGAGFVSVLLGI